MQRVITINCNDIEKSIETKHLLIKKLESAGFSVLENLTDKTELIISIGGDGSFLKTIRDFDYPTVPIFGINTGHLGFFPDISPEFIDDFIKSYKNNSYIIKEIYLLQADIYTKTFSTTAYAVNEFVIKGDKSRTTHLKVKVDDKLIQNFSGDGLIISTPTGSTAYNYSAGGSIVDPSLNIMQLTPLSPINTNAYRCFTSSIILAKDSKIKISPEFKFENSILTVVDGVEHKFSEIENVQISISDIKIKLLRMPHYEFWGRVGEKFL
jgi:NAD+ kinase